MPAKRRGSESDSQMAGSRTESAAEAVPALAMPNAETPPGGASSYVQSLIWGVANKSKRKQIGRYKACARCYSRQTRCDGNRPCSSCIRQQCADQCADRPRNPESSGSAARRADGGSSEQGVSETDEVQSTGAEYSPLPRMAEAWARVECILKSLEAQERRGQGDPGHDPMVLVEARDFQFGV